MDTARLVVEVVAGLLPGKDPDPDYTRRYVITGTEWRKAGDEDQGRGQALLLAEVNGKAQGYAAMLMNSPNLVNWVRTDWVWM